MFFRAAFKWLAIAVIVVFAFLVVLLFLGYLLKENAVKTTQLKAQLEQAAVQQQEKSRRLNNSSANLQSQLTTIEKSQQEIITNNRSCNTSKQCFLVHTNSQVLGCIVSVNTTGAAILLKVASEKKSDETSNELCQQVYLKQRALNAQCRSGLCSF